MTAKRLAIHLAFVFATLSLGILAGFFNPPGAWYAGLVKPAFNPPNWLFGPVWTVLYILVGVAGARTWLDRPGSLLSWLWSGQMALNLAWSPAMFGLQSLVLGLLVIVLMLAGIAAFTVLALRQDRIAALLFLPYLAWVGFATLLNATLYALN